MPGYTYILKCADDSYYTGSTIDIKKRLEEHKEGRGANHTAKYGPVELVYLEVYSHVYKAFRREKQIQGWPRQKKETLISSEFNKLVEYSKAFWQREN